MVLELVCPSEGSILALGTEPRVFHLRQKAGRNFPAHSCSRLGSLAVVHGDICAGPSQSDCDPGTDAAARAGHKGNFGYSGLAYRIDAALDG